MCVEKSNFIFILKIVFFAMIQYMYHDMNIAFLQYLYENVFGHDENEDIKIAKTKWFSFCVRY